MRLVFAGTPEFARSALQSLHASGHTIALVLTQPDRPAGRGLQLQASAVKQYAQAHGFALAQPRSLRLDGKYPQDALDAQACLAAAQADAMVVAAYGLLLPQWVLDAMRQHGLGLGCLNIHASLLPRWRGAAPIHRAIEAGDAQTGITIMQMDAGLDTGDMLLSQSLDIAAGDTTGSLHERLAPLGGALIVQALDALAAGRLRAQPQPEAGVCYAHKIAKAEGALDWTQDAQTLVRRIHAFNPFPGATAQIQGETLKIWDAQVSDRTLTAPAVAGEIIGVSRMGIEVAAMNSVVSLQYLQRPGGKRLTPAQLLQGFALHAGMRFDSTSTRAAAAA